MILLLWASFCTFLISVVFHEIGHLQYLRRVLGVNVPLYVSWSEIVVGDDKHYKNLSPVQYDEMLKAGIFLGAVPLVVIYLIEPITWVLFIPYLIGCISDFKNITDLQRDKKY